MPLRVRLTDWLGLSVHGWQTDWSCTREIVRAAARYDKSSRGTPRLRRPPRILHVAARLAVQAAPVNSWFWLWFWFGADAWDIGLGQTFSISRACAEGLAWSSLEQPLAIFHLARSWTGAEWFQAVRSIRGFATSQLPIGPARPSSIHCSTLRGCSVHADRRTSCWS